MMLYTKTVLQGKFANVIKNRRLFLSDEFKCVEHWHNFIKLSPSCSKEPGFPSCIHKSLPSYGELHRTKSGTNNVIDLPFRIKKWNEKTDLEIVNHANIRNLLNSNSILTIINELNNSSRYGIYLDEYTGCLLLNQLLLIKDYLNAAKVAVHLVVESELENKLTIAMTLYAIYMFSSRKIVNQLEMESKKKTSNLKEPLPNFEPISMGEMPSNIDMWLIRSDQSYLYRMVLAVDSSHCGKNLASEQPGATSTARWLTTASRILRWYVTQAQPSQKLRDLAMFVVRVYAPFWFLVKSQPLAIHGSRNVFKYISWIRDLPNYVQLAIKPTIESNAYYFHHENILLSMITDPDATVRADGYSKILQARLNAPGRIRQFRGPKHQPYINYRSNIYTEMIDWTQSEPPCLQFHTQDQLSDMQYSDQLIKIPDYLCHSQNTERFVQIVHQSATAVTDENRLGHIFAKLDSCERYSYLESRKDLED